MNYNEFRDTVLCYAQPEGLVASLQSNGTAVLYNPVTGAIQTITVAGHVAAQKAVETLRKTGTNGGH